MGRVIDIFSHQKIEARGKLSSSHSLDSVSVQNINRRLITYDPQMPIALEAFASLNKSILLSECWVPLTWDKNGIVVLVDDPSDLEKKASIKAAFETDRMIYAFGSKDDIKAFINRAFAELEELDFLLSAMSGKEPVDVAKLVDIIISKAYTLGISDIWFESSASALSGKNRVLFWMGGVYREYMTLEEVVAFDVVKRIKSIANLDAGDRQLAKVGHLILKNNDVPEIKISVTTYPIDGLWEDVVLRILAA